MLGKIKDLLAGKIREPVKEIVELVKKHPRQHGLKLISDNHLCFNLYGDQTWRGSFAYHTLWTWRGDCVEWMSEREARYVYHSLRPLLADDCRTRAGWIAKIKSETKEKE